MTDRTEAPQTILVVEDEVFIRMVISEYLRGCGYRVIEAVSADEAITLLQHSELDVDVVFSDIEMPGSMNGFELSDWVRTNRSGVDVVLAGNVSRAANAAAQLCESGPLPKPYEPQFARGAHQNSHGTQESRQERLEPGRDRIALRFDSLDARLTARN